MFHSDFCQLTGRAFSSPPPKPSRIILSSNRHESLPIIIELLARFPGCMNAMEDAAPKSRKVYFSMLSSKSGQFEQGFESPDLDR